MEYKDNIPYTTKMFIVVLTKVQLYKLFGYNWINMKIPTKVKS